MTTHVLILLTLFTPFFCFLLLAINSVFQKNKTNETCISHIVGTSFVLYLFGSSSTSLLWILNGCKSYHWAHTPLLSLYFNWSSLVYLCVTAILTNIILFYSRRYLHRDPGYRRFFMVLSLFVTGLTVVIFAGNFELIFYPSYVI